MLPRGQQLDRFWRLCPAHDIYSCTCWWQKSTVTFHDLYQGSIQCLRESSWSFKPHFPVICLSSTNLERQFLHPQEEIIKMGRFSLPLKQIISHQLYRNSAFLSVSRCNETNHSDITFLQRCMYHKSDNLVLLNLSWYFYDTRKWKMSILYWNLIYCNELRPGVSSSCPLSNECHLVIIIITGHMCQETTDCTL